MKGLGAVVVVLGMAGLGVVNAVYAKEGGKMIEDGRTVSFDYTLTVNGEVVDSSAGRKPLTYVHGKGTIIPGLSKQLEGLKEGSEKKIIVGPEDAYGIVDPKAFQEVPRNVLPKDIELKPGMVLQAATPDGKKTLVRVSELRGDKVLLNFNHPLAGKTLEFQVKIVSIK